MNKSDGEESCYTDYETDGFWSAEKTLLESVKGGGGASTTKRRKKKKKSARERGDGKKDAAATGLRQQWWCFVRDNDEQWHELSRSARRCFVDTVRNALARVQCALPV